MSVNDSLFEQFCCSVKEFEKTKVQSKNDIIVATERCFEGLNITEKKQLELVFDFFISDDSPFKEEDCALQILSCDTTPTAWHLAYFFLWTFILIVTVTSNITVIAAVRTISYIRDHIGNFLLSSLAASDIAVCLFIIPVRMKYAYNNLYFCSLNLCRMYVTTDTTFFSISITNLLFIAIDRMLVLNYPYRYKSWLTLQKSKVVVFCIWVYGFTWGLLSNVNWNNPHTTSIQVKNHQCMVNDNRNFVATVYILVFYIPATIMAFMYYQILAVAKYHAKVTNNNAIPKIFTSAEGSSFIDGSFCEQDEDSSTSATINRETLSPRKCASRILAKLKQSKALLKTSKTAATIYGTFFVCWFPVSVYSMANAFSDMVHNEEQLKWFHIMFVEILPLLNSMMNPFLYAFMNRQYRRAFKVVLMQSKDYLMARMKY